MVTTGLRGWFSVGALACALAAGTVPASQAQAQSQSKADEARIRYEKGVELHTEGDFQSALIEFKRSYEVVPNYHVLYNIGQVYFQLADYANALRTFQQYLDDGGKRIPVSRRSDVERDVDKLRSRVATITLKLNVPDAEVRVDDQLVQIPDSGVLLVSAGKRKIEISKPGFKPVTRTEEIAGEEKRELKLELVQELTPDDRPIIVPGPATEEGPPVVPIILWSLTGALAVGTGVTGALALSADSTLDRLKNERGNTEEQIQSQADQATTLALITDILLAASVVSAGVSTVFTVLEFTGGEPVKEGPAAPTASLRVGPLGVFVDGRF
jgi:tetratricopeptide (TPR) repeat protein